MSEMFQDCSISSAKLSVLLRVLLCGVDGGDEYSANRSAIVQYSFCDIIRDNARFLCDFNPVFCFVAFFQSNMQFSDKIGTAVSIFRLADICADACAASLKLIRQGIVSFDAIGQF